MHDQVSPAEMQNLLRELASQHSCQEDHDDVVECVKTTLSEPMQHAHADGSLFTLATGGLGTVLN